MNMRMVDRFTPCAPKDIPGTTNEALDSANLIIKNMSAEERLAYVEKWLDQDFILAEGPVTHHYPTARGPNTGAIIRYSLARVDFQEWLVRQVLSEARHG